MAPLSTHAPEVRSALDALEAATVSGTWVMEFIGLEATRWWSAGTRRLIEWPDDEPLPGAEGAETIYSPSSRAVLSEAVARAARDGTPFDLEVEINTRGGRLLHTRTTGLRENDGRDGRPVRIAGTIQDVGAKFMAEQRARELDRQLIRLEARWRLAAEASGLGVWDWNVGAGRIEFSGPWEQLIGHPASSLPSEPAAYVLRVHPDDRERRQVALDAHLAGQTPVYASEHRLRGRDGRYRWVLERGRVIERTSGKDGLARRAIGTCADINQRKFLENVNAQVGARYEGVFHSTYQFMALLSPEGELLEINRTAIDFGGIDAEKVRGSRFWETPWWQPADGAPDPAVARERLRAAVAQAASGEAVRYETTISGRLGPAIVDFSLKPVRGEGDEVTLIVAEGRDITAQVLARRALDEKNQLFRATFDEAPIGTAIVSTAGGFIEVNDALCKIVGYPRAELLALTFQDITHPDDLETDLELLDGLLDGRADHYSMDKRYFHADGRVVNIQLDVSAVRDAEGRVMHFLSQIQDISERRGMAAALTREKDLAQATLTAIGDGVIRTDRHGRIEFVSETALRLLKSVSADVLGKPFDEVIRLTAEHGGLLLESPVRRVLREGLPLHRGVQAVLILRDGGRLPVEDSCAPIHDAEGALIGSVFGFHDVSAARDLARQLHHQARHDTLTGLPNRREFEAELDALLLATRRAAAEEHPESHHLMLLDLDRFKAINDHCGHAAGDTVLREISQRMKSQLRTTDLLSRIGGDEFAVLLRHADAERATRVAHGLVAAVAAYRYAGPEKDYTLGLSAGLTPLDPRVDASVLLRRADGACYAAKARGRGQMVYAAPEETSDEGREETRRAGSSATAV